VELEPAQHAGYRTRLFATLEKKLGGEPVKVRMGFHGHSPVPGLQVEKLS
jgi:hypothetical protein